MWRCFGDILSSVVYLTADMVLIIPVNSSAQRARTHVSLEAVSARTDRSMTRNSFITSYRCLEPVLKITDGCLYL